MKKFFLLFHCSVFLIHIGTAQDSLLLKDFEPVSIYNIQKTEVKKAKYRVIDVHTHPNPGSKEAIEEWVKTMDDHGIKKSLVLTYSTGQRFDSIYNLYSRYGDRFEVWCGFDYTGYNEPGWSAKAV